MPDWSGMCCAAASQGPSAVRPPATSVQAHVRPTIPIVGAISGTAAAVLTPQHNPAITVQHQHGRPAYLVPKGQEAGVMIRQGGQPHLHLSPQLSAAEIERRQANFAVLSGQALPPPSASMPPQSLPTMLPPSVVVSQQRPSHPHSSAAAPGNHMRSALPSMSQPPARHVSQPHSSQSWQAANARALADQQRRWTPPPPAPDAAPGRVGGAAAHPSATTPAALQSAAWPSLPRADSRGGPGATMAMSGSGPLGWQHPAAGGA